MIYQGDIIKHRAALDTAVQIMSATKHAENGSYEIRGMWLNQGFVDTYAINILAEFTIKKEDLSNWMKCLLTLDEIRCIRNANWAQLCK